MWRGQEDKGESSVEGVASLVLFHSAAQTGSESQLSPTSPVPLSCPYIYLWESNGPTYVEKGRCLGHGEQPEAINRKGLRRNKKHRKV